MKTLIRFAVLLVAGWTGWATTFTEWYVDNNAGNLGANTNSGSTASATPAKSAVSGNWTNTTATFYKSGLDPVATVNVGDWAAVYADGASVAAFVSRVTARDDTADTITLSTTAFAGANPADIVGTASITVGGAWKGPNGTVGFPFNFIAATATNSSATAFGYTPRVNFKGGTTYSITAGMTHSLAGPVRFQGYTTTVGDGGKATIDGGTTAAHLLAHSGNGADYADLVFAHNATGSYDGVNVSGTTVNFYRCIFHDLRRNGLNAAASAVECEAYACNQGNISLGAGIGGTAILIGCVSHDNVGGGNASGFYTGSAYSVMSRCIAYNNSGTGLLCASTASGCPAIYNCDFYSNALAGVTLSGAAISSMEVVNCNFAKNAGAAITNSGTYARFGNIINCGYGSGTAANTAGNIMNLPMVLEINPITYATDTLPWVDAPNGNFAPITTAKSVGRLVFPQSTVTPTAGWLDMGAAQSASTNAATTAHSHVFAQ